jgi:hypothetical protein
MAAVIAAKADNNDVFRGKQRDEVGWFCTSVKRNMRIIHRATLSVAAGSRIQYSRSQNKNSHPKVAIFILAERTGLEPATPGVTGRYSNQLNYRSR